MQNYRFSRVKALLIFLLISESMCWSASEETAQAWEWFLRLPSPQTPYVVQDTESDLEAGFDPEKLKKEQLEEEKLLKEYQDFWRENAEELFDEESDFSQSEFYLKLKNKSDPQTLTYLVISLLHYDPWEFYQYEDDGVDYSGQSLAMETRIEDSRLIMELLDDDSSEFFKKHFIEFLKRVSAKTDGHFDENKFWPDQNFVKFAQSVLADFTYSEEELMRLRTLPDLVWNTELVGLLLKNCTDNIQLRNLSLQFLHHSPRKENFALVEELFQRQVKTPLEEFSWSSLLEVVYHIQKTNRDDESVDQLAKTIQANLLWSDHEMSAHLRFLEEVHAKPEDMSRLSMKYLMSENSGHFVLLAVLDLVNQFPELYALDEKNLIVERVYQEKKDERNELSNIQVLGIIMQSEESLEIEKGPSQSFSNIYQRVFLEHKLSEAAYKMILKYVEKAKRNIWPYDVQEKTDRNEIVSQCLFYVFSKLYTPETAFAAIEFFSKTSLSVGGRDELLTHAFKLLDLEAGHRLDSLIELLKKYPDLKNLAEIEKVKSWARDKSLVLFRKKLNDVPMSSVWAFEISLLFDLPVNWSGIQEHWLDDLQEAYEEYRLVYDGSGCNTGILDMWTSNTKPKLERIMKTMEFINQSNGGAASIDLLATIQSNEAYLRLGQYKPMEFSN